MRRKCAILWLVKLCISQVFPLPPFRVFFCGLYICYLFQQTHQKNQVKDTIEVEEPEDAGEPLTAVEQEEKERLLEEVSVSTNSS